MLVQLAVSEVSRSSAAIVSMLAVEFPSVEIRRGSAGAPPHLRASEWASERFDAWSFDVAIDELARDPFTLSVDAEEIALPALTRCQRHVRRRNAPSSTALFDRVLEAHRALHDLDKPLVRADYNHALDAWQWLLRLDASAPAALQYAALFHDIERIGSEGDARVEHLAADYQQFKDAHAHAGARIADAVLAGAGVDATTRRLVTALVAHHERASTDPAIALLNDADALSFFSLNSPGYASYFGPEQTRKKVAYTWNRMSGRARLKLASVWLRRDVRTILDAVVLANGKEA